MPLVINGLGGGHTHTHTHIPTREPKQFQETRRARPSAARAWFKNWKSKLDYKIVSQNLAIKLEAKIGLYSYKVGSQNWTKELEVKIGLYN